MKLAVYDTTKNKVEEIKLPFQFEEQLRPDLIHRAVMAIQSHKRQNYATSKKAGKRASTILSKRRKDYRGSYGFGISRTPRKIITRRGRRMNWVGAFSPNTVSGRRAHPPKSEKKYWKKINDNEMKKAIRSAIAATILKDVVTGRGHIIPDNYPFILDDKFESLDKTKKVIDAFNRLGLKDELERVGEKKIRPGKGKSRGRKYKKKNGPLVIVSQTKKLSKAVSNIPGIDIIQIKSLNTELLAPGAKAGRLTLWTSAAINILEKDKMFK